jgi:hypothetical protein
MKNRLEHTNNLFLELQLLKCVDLVNFKTAIIMYKANHKLLPYNLQQLFEFSRNAPYNTSQKLYPVFESKQGFYA